jgi:hypothetical protein
LGGYCAKNLWRRGWRPLARSMYCFAGMSDMMAGCWREGLQLGGDGKVEVKFRGSLSQSEDLGSALFFALSSEVVSITTFGATTTIVRIE